MSYRRAGADRHEVVGHKYVGRARADGIEVQICEKVPGTLVALLAAATGSALRIEKESSPATEFDAISRHLLKAFLRASERYIADRRQPRYLYRDAQGPMLGGRLDMPATLRLHASGRLGRFAYEEGTVVRDEPLDRLVLAGLSELDRAGAALNLDPEALYDARWLAGALEEVRDERFLATSRASFLLIADEVERSAASLPENVDLARLAAAALLHRGFAPDMPAQGEVPRAWFIDLETLFEQAVRDALRDQLLRDAVDRGEGFARRMFTGGSDQSRTNPDLVIHRDSTPRAVGDVKYKAPIDGVVQGAAEPASKPGSSGREDRADIYQVLVHAASLNADFAFLVNAADVTYACKYLGTAATGCRMWTVKVRPHHLSKDLSRFIEESGLSKPDELDYAASSLRSRRRR